MPNDCPTVCPTCHAPITAHALSFYAPRLCLECGWGEPEARELGKRDLIGTLALAAGSVGMVVLGVLGVVYGSNQAQVLGALGVAGLILAMDRSLQAWEFLRQVPVREHDTEEGGWCPPELSMLSPRDVSRRQGFERPMHALSRMLMGVACLAGMASFAPVTPWERRALIGFAALAVLPMLIRPLRITLEDWRHQRLASYGRKALGNVLAIERTWYGGAWVRYRYHDGEGKPHEGRVWHPAPPEDLLLGAAFPVLYRHGEPGISVPYPASRYEVTSHRRRARFVSG